MPSELRQLLVPIGYSLSNTGPPAFPGLPPVLPLSDEPYGAFLRTPGSWDIPLRVHGYAFAIGEEAQLALLGQAFVEPVKGVELLPSIWAAGTPGGNGAGETVLGAAVRMRASRLRHLGVDLWSGAAWDFDNHAAWGYLGVELGLDASDYEYRWVKAMYQASQDGARGIAEEVPDTPSILGLGYGDRLKGATLTQETEVLVSLDPIRARADELSARWRLGAEPVELTAHLRHDPVEEKGVAQLGISIGDLVDSVRLKLEASAGYEHARIVRETIRAELATPLGFEEAESNLSIRPILSVAMQRPGPKISDYLSVLGHAGVWEVSGNFQIGVLLAGPTAELELSVGIGIDEPIDPLILDGIAPSEVLSGKASQLVDFVLSWSVRSREGEAH